MHFYRKSYEYCKGYKSMKIEKFTGSNKRVFNTVNWTEVSEPKGVIQIIHGMAEHVERYDEFARFLNSNGYLVVGSDLRGHGNTALENNSVGVCETGNPFFDNMSDQIMLTKYLKEKYNLPVMIFGHSYGSFITQAYIQNASDLLAGIVLCGSAKQDGILIKSGKMVACMQAKLFNKDKPAKMLTNMAFKPYDELFKEDKSVNCWISSDQAECEKYNVDPLCGMVMSIDFFKSMSGAFMQLYKAESLNKIKRDLPIFIISGDCDPVGGFGKATTNLYNCYKSNGLADVIIKLYPKARHEILNDVVRDQVMADVLEYADRLFVK